MVITHSSPSKDNTEAAKNMPVPDFEGERLLSVDEVAEVMACSERTVRNLITRGHLHAFRLGPGRTAYRVPVSALLHFMIEHGGKA